LKAFRKFAESVCDAGLNVKLDEPSATIVQTPNTPETTTTTKV
jgi:hypothetical protein